METESGKVEPGHGEDAKRVVARLVIELHADSTIKVEGNISDKMLSYGLLESARDAIFEHGLRVKQTNPGTHRVMDFLRRK